MKNVNITTASFDNALVDFFNHYHTNVKSHKFLYQYSDTTFQITYPVTLHDYAMSGTGNHGKNAGYAPIGTPIIECDDAAKALKNIFATVESLKTWVLDNRIIGINYRKFAGVKVAKQEFVISNTIARKVFWDKADKAKYDEMTVKYGKKTVDNDLMTLTWNEFDLRYGFVAI